MNRSSLMGAPVICALFASACGASDGASGASVDSGAIEAPPSTPTNVEPSTSEPSLEAPPPVTIDEDATAEVAVIGKGIRVFDAEGLPPGARFDRATGTVTFRPDFTQSGTYEISVTGHAGGPPATFSKTVKVVIVVRDSISPPAPVVKNTVAGDGFSRLTVEQTTDAYLDSPGHAGRKFSAVVVVPSSPTPNDRVPVVVGLHGFGGSPNASAGGKTFRIEPHDPDSTYWWGYAESLPGAPATNGPVPAYTLRRELHLLSWVLRTYPMADPDRVFSTGGSMGGAGALTLGLVFGRHFAGIEATIAPTIPRHHRPSRVAQLTKLWGAPQTNVAHWDALEHAERAPSSSRLERSFAGASARRAVSSRQPRTPA